MVQFASDSFKNQMGVFSVPITVRKWLPPDSSSPGQERSEEITCDALVDCGTMDLALPAEMIERLRLVQVGTIGAYTADGRKQRLRLMGMIEVEVKGRKSQGRVVELPRGALPLLGAVPLELMDWHISPKGRELVPNPDSPDEPLLPLM